MYTFPQIVHGIRLEIDSDSRLIECLQTSCNKYSAVVIQLRIQNMFDIRHDPIANVVSSNADFSLEGLSGRMATMVWPETLAVFLDGGGSCRAEFSFFNSFEIVLDFWNTPWQILTTFGQVVGLEGIRRSDIVEFLFFHFLCNRYRIDRWGRMLVMGAVESSQHIYNVICSSVSGAIYRISAKYGGRVMYLLCRSLS